ncbi:hypothetical protein MMC34_005407 [Xylographa carneopallida]|nr:hypothetical protein [Xylographa carneopallida]
MLFKLATLALVGSALAQRPANTSICDYYTTALLKENTAANQATLLTLVVNTAVIGNYTKPNVGIKVPGILAAGMYNGTNVNLLPYFDGGLASSNNGTAAVAMNFLDDGGAVPLMMNMPANGTTSNQYYLLTHLYQYFGVLLGCSLQGPSATSTFPSYQGEASQYSVHKYMDLSAAEVGYFITQVGLAAASFGVATADVTAVGMALASLFDYSCAPPTTVIPAQGPQLQAICIDSTCPVSPNATCAAYPMAMQPLVANVSLAMGEGVNSTSSMGSGTATATGTMVPTITPASGAGKSVAGGVMAAAAGLVALVL